jgi:hypothetical protein
MAQSQRRTGSSARWRYVGTAGGKRSAKGHQAESQQSATSKRPADRSAVKADAVLPLPSLLAPRASGARRRPRRSAGSVRPLLPLRTALAWTALAIAIGAGLSLVVRQTWVLGLTAIAVALFYLWRQLR